MNNQDELIESLTENATPEQVAQLLELGEGDTGKAPEAGGEPDASNKPGKDNQSDAGNLAGEQQNKSGDIQDQNLDPDNAVILARDGKHTIGYEKLVEARNGKQQAEASLATTQQQLAEAQAQLKRLQDEAKARADAGQEPTETDKQIAAAQAAIDKGVDLAAFGDFSEESLAKGIQAVVDKRVASVLAQIDAKVDAKLAPIQHKQTTDAHTAHLQAIYDAHPDADSIVESKELADWLAAQLSFVRDSCAAVLTNGNHAQVIELFDNFKKATGVHQEAGATRESDTQAKAKEAIARSEAAVPASLSDFPGGRASGKSRDEAMADMGAIDLLSAMDDWTHEQIERFLNRL